MQDSWIELRDTKRTGAVKVWKIRQDDERYYIEHGQLGGKMQATSGRPGPKGRPGTKSYMDAVSNCEFNVQRFVRKKLEKGYVAVDSEVVQPTKETVDFSKPLSKSFCPYKPSSEKELTPEEHERIYEAGSARYTVKRDGECHIAVNHTFGWRIYTRRIVDVTDKFMSHAQALFASMLPVGTIFVGEMHMPGPSGNDDPAVLASYTRSLAGRVDTNAVPDFSVFDILFYNGKDLKDSTYDERMGILSNINTTTMTFTLGKTRLISFVNASPKTWEQIISRLGAEGLVLVDGTSVPGSSFYSFNGTPRRPAGHYKLKLRHHEDVVAYAAILGNGANEKTIGSFAIKQLDPTTKCWFDCGKVGSGLTSTGGHLDRDKMLKFSKSIGLPVVESDTQLTDIPLAAGPGLVLEIEYSDRQKGTNKFKFPSVIRVRKDKSIGQCVAQYMRREK